MCQQSMSKWWYCADDVNRYDCTCEAGYTGADCETSRSTITYNIFSIN